MVFGQWRCPGTSAPGWVWLGGFQNDWLPSLGPGHVSLLLAKCSVQVVGHAQRWSPCVFLQTCAVWAPGHCRISGSVQIPTLGVHVQEKASRVSVYHVQGLHRVQPPRVMLGIVFSFTRN